MKKLSQCLLSCIQSPIVWHPKWGTFGNSAHFQVNKVYNANIKHRKNCECCPCHSLIKGHNVIVDIVVLNCHKCNQCHKSLGLIFEGVL